MAGQGLSPQDLIRQEAEALGLPWQLALAVAEQESNFDPYASNPKIVEGESGPAYGTFQLLPSTAARLKVDPRDPIQNIRGGLRYLKELHDKYGGDPQKVLAEFGGVKHDTQYVPGAMARLLRYQQGANPTGAADVTTETSDLFPAPAPTQTPTPLSGPERLVKRSVQSFRPSVIKQGLTDLITATDQSIAAKGGPPPPPPRTPGSPAIPDFAGERYAGEMLNTIGRAAYGAGEQLWKQGAATEQGAPGLFDAGSWADYLRGLEGRLKKSMAVIPFAGPVLNEAYEQYKGGDPWTGTGALIDVGTQVFGPKIAGKVASKLPIGPLFRPVLNPKERAAIDLARREGVEGILDTAAVSGNQFARTIQQGAEATAFGAPVAARMGKARDIEMPALGERLAERVHPQPTSPIQAGEALQRGVETYVGRQSATSSGFYNVFERIAADPRNTRQVPVSFSNQWTPQGTLQRVPVMGPMQLPADLRGAQRILRPILAELEKAMPVAQQQFSQGLQALRNVVNAHPFMPAVELQKNLSAIKALAREGVPHPDLRNVNQGLSAKAVSTLEPVLQQAVAGAPHGGAVASRALAGGARATKAKWAAEDALKAVTGEPEKALASVIGGRKDAHLVHLQELQRIAPQEIPTVARGVLEDIFSKGTFKGGWDKQVGMHNAWEALGPETRKILFGPNADDLDSFFMLSEMLYRHGNPSRSAFAGMAIASLTAIPTEIWATGGPPFFSVGTLGLAGVVAKVMNSPGGVRWLTEGLRIPAGGAEQAAWLANGVRILGADTMQELRGGPTQRTQAGPPPRPPFGGFEGGELR